MASDGTGDRGAGDISTSDPSPSWPNPSTDHGERASWQTRCLAMLVVLDLAAFVVGTLAATVVRFKTLDAAVSSSGGRVPYLLGGLLLAPLWALMFALCGVYDARRLGHGSEEYRSILDAAVKFLALVAIVALVIKLGLARTMVAITLPLACALSLVGHYAVRRWLHRRRASGSCMRNVLVVGSARQVADLVRHFRRSRHAGLEVVAACVPGTPGKIVVDGETIPVVGQPSETVAALQRVRADTVALADHESLSNGALRRLGWELEGSGTELLVAPSVIDVAGPRIAIYPVAGLPLLHVEEPKVSGLNRVIKGGVERAVAAVALVVLSPVFLLVGIAVRATSRGPAVFRQVRIGQGGDPFTLYKFRTMRATAEQERIDLDEHNDHDGILFKIRADPRRTRVGRWLRRLSLDELPQLWNVVRGEMSIVGPRPPLPSEVAQYSYEVRRRLLVKPGLTGLWQVSGRSDLPWPEAVRLDLYYVENWSPALDLVILAKTVTAVLRGRGAY